MKIMKDVPVVKVGDRVRIGGGKLYNGIATVRKAYYPKDDCLPVPKGFDKDQPFPQVGVITSDGRKIRYNGRDLCRITMTPVEVVEKKAETTLKCLYALIAVGDDGTEVPCRFSQSKSALEEFVRDAFDDTDCYLRNDVMLMDSSDDNCREALEAIFDNYDPDEEEVAKLKIEEYSLNEVFADWIK